MGKIIIYSNGIVSCSVCADNTLSKTEVEELANEKNPLEEGLKWKISKDKTFSSGETNPCECETYPEDRKHYLLNC